MLNERLPRLWREHLHQQPHEIDMFFKSEQLLKASKAMVRTFTSCLINKVQAEDFGNHIPELTTYFAEKCQNGLNADVFKDKKFDLDFKIIMNAVYQVNVKASASLYLKCSLCILTID